MKLAPLVIATLAACGSSSDSADPTSKPVDPAGKDAPTGKPAACDEAAEDLASIELGNYADPEVRAPAVERYRKRCREAPLTREELACLDKTAKKRWQAIDCAPRMFAELERLVKADCENLVKHLSDVAAASDNPRERARATPELIEAMRTSCTEDAWPASARRCLLMAESSNALGTCMSEMPPEVERKRRERARKAQTK